MQRSFLLISTLGLMGIFALPAVAEDSRIPLIAQIEPSTEADDVPDTEVGIPEADDYTDDDTGLPEADDYIDESDRQAPDGLETDVEPQIEVDNPEPTGQLDDDTEVSPNRDDLGIEQTPQTPPFDVNGTDAYSVPDSDVDDIDFNGEAIEIEDDLE